MFVKILAFAAIIALANGHGYLKEPIARTSIQLRPEFGTEQPYWWDNTGVWCGNVQQDTRYSNCGRCGDAPGESTANQGGIYDKNVIVATYQSGSVISVVSELTAGHMGHVEIELCSQQQETDGCFQKLQIVGGDQEVRGGNRICLGSAGWGGQVTAQVQLPSGVRCERCTLRWTYRTSYPGHCSDPAKDDCDNPCDAQTFRNCADVKIV